LGGSRILAPKRASITVCLSRIPAGNSTDEMRFAANPISMKSPDLRENVVDHAQSERRKRAEHAIGVREER